MWNLMDTPLEEQEKFHHVTSKIATLESEFTEQVHREVRMLEQLKSTEMKEVGARGNMQKSTSDCTNIIT
ncbi:Microtubule associated protein [Sesbania bispinosa]|nr:Microtubule associated protein [Sesbania bispinosa]